MRDAIWYLSTQEKMYRGWREYANQAKWRRRRLATKYE